MTGTSFAIPVTRQVRDIAAKFHPDRPGGLVGEVEKGDGWTDRRRAMMIPYLEFKFQI